MDEFTRRAREAFALGVASTGAAITPRVQAGLVAAVDLAREHHLEPGVLEATLQLGQLEGTWARVFERREQLYADHTQLVTVAWRELAATSNLDLGGTIAKFRRGQGLTSETADDTDDRREEAAALALLLLALLLRDRSQAAYVALIAAVSAAIHAAEAEGVAGAVALVAQKLGYSTIDFDHAYAVAYAEADTPAAREERAALAAAVIADIVTGTASDLGALWARLVDEDADYGDMLAASSELLDGDDQRAVSVPVDLAMGSGFTRAALALFRDAGATQVDFITAGDGRVCSRCDSAEARGPYDIGSAPAPPLHPFCRCTLTVRGAVTGTALTRFLGDAS